MEASLCPFSLLVKNNQLRVLTLTVTSVASAVVSLLELIQFIEAGGGGTSHSGQTTSQIHGVVVVAAAAAAHDGRQVIHTLKTRHAL